jgi:hypothetical protein
MPSRKGLVRSGFYTICLMVTPSQVLPPSNVKRLNSRSALLRCQESHVLARSCQTPDARPQFLLAFLRSCVASSQPWMSCKPELALESSLVAQFSLWMPMHSECAHIVFELVRKCKIDGVIIVGPSGPINCPIPYLSRGRLEKRLFNRTSLHNALDASEVQHQLEVSNTC